MAKDEKSTAYKSSGSMFSETWRRLRRNKLAMIGLFILIVFVVVALLAGVLYPEGYDVQSYDDAFLLPTLEHPFGCDNIGRDILCRVVWGSSISLRIVFFTLLIGCSAGTLIGLVCAFNKSADMVIMRFVDICMAIPDTLLALCVAATLGQGLTNLIIAMSFGVVPRFTRVVRAQVLSIKEMEYIEAATAIGGTKLRIMFKHALPNSLSPIIVQITVSAAETILSASALSFLGCGVPMPQPEWGAMLSAAKEYLRNYPHLAIFPGIAILLVAFSLNVLGDGLRDALDPKLKQ